MNSIDILLWNDYIKFIMNRRSWSKLHKNKKIFNWKLRAIIASCNLDRQIKSNFIFYNIYAAKFTFGV